MNWVVLTSAVPAVLISWLVGLLLRQLAPRWGLVDRPGPRKVHTQSVPFGGGIAIWAGVVIPLALGNLLLWRWNTLHREAPSGSLDLSALGAWGERLAAFVEPHLPGLVQQSADLWFLLMAGTVLMFLGLVDDVRKLDWRFRLAIELIVAGAVVYGRGWALTIFLDWPLVTNALSVLWIVWLVNSFNMLDNMDGLSGGVAAIAAAMLALVLLRVSEASSQQPKLFVAGFLFVLVGALVGFLLHNWPPARLFMGDAGAYFIGFCVAVMTILATFSGNGLPRHAILAPLCVLAVPFYDTLSVICIRLRAGRSVFEGDTNHLSHRLVALGLTKTGAVLTIYLLTAACGLGALLLDQVNLGGAVTIVLMIGCLLAVIAILENAARRKMRQ